MIPSTIWCNLDLPVEALEELREGTQGYELVLGHETPSGEVAVAFGQPPVEALGLPGLKWFQITSAGYTRYDTVEFREGLAGIGGRLSNSSSVFDEPCAQHLLAFVLAIARQLPEAMADQLGKREWPAEGIRKRSWLLRDQTILLVGYGAIAKRFAELVAPFGVELIGVRRTVKGDEGIPMVTIEELDGVLPKADHVANILPANASTDGLFGAERFGAMKPGALFYNIGRGTTVDQAALRDALRSGHLAGAYLDVTDPEPLPAEHALWSAPNCFITPHTAGGHDDEWQRLVRHFLGNLRRFEAGEALLDRVM